jgi:hypothetical protein
MLPTFQALLRISAWNRPDGDAQRLVAIPEYPSRRWSEALAAFLRDRDLLGQE